MAYENLEQTALVRGGLGFVGRNLVSGLLNEPNIGHITIIDDCSNSSPDIPAGWEGRVEHLKLSVTEEDWLDRLSGMTAVFHLACKTILECDDNPVYDAQVNTMSTLRILERIHQMHERKRPNFVYTSSACVYGRTPNEPIDENFPLRPTSAYGISKMSGEAYTLTYAAKGLHASALRLSNVYGPGQTPDNPYCGVLGKFLNLAERGKPLTVYGDGQQSRDFTYVGDAVKAIITASNNRAADGQRFNVATGTATSVQDLVRVISNLYPDVTTLTLPERTIDDIRHRILDAKKAEEVLGWRPATSLNDGIVYTQAWMHNAVV